MGYAMEAGPITFVPEQRAQTAQFVERTYPATRTTPEVNSEIVDAWWYDCGIERKRVQNPELNEYLATVDPYIAALDKSEGYKLKAEAYQSWKTSKIEVNTEEAALRAEHDRYISDFDAQTEAFNKLTRDVFSTLLDSVNKILDDDKQPTQISKPVLETVKKAEIEVAASPVPFSSRTLLNEMKRQAIAAHPPTPIYTQIAGLAKGLSKEAIDVVVMNYSSLQSEAVERWEQRVAAGEHLNMNKLDPLILDPQLLKKAIIGSLVVGGVALMTPGAIANPHNSELHLSHTLSAASTAKLPLTNLLKQKPETTKLVSPDRKYQGAENIAVSATKRQELAMEASSYARGLVIVGQKQLAYQENNKVQNPLNAKIISEVDGFIAQTILNLIADQAVPLTPEIMTVAAEHVANVQLAARFPSSIKDNQLSNFQRQNAALIINNLFVGDAVNTYSSAEQLNVANAITGAAEAMMPADKLAEYVQSLDMTSTRDEPNLPTPVLTAGFMAPSVEAVAQALANVEVAPSAAKTASSNQSVSEILSVEAMQSILPHASHENIDSYTPMVLEALAERKIDSKFMIAYALATINAETSAFAPIPEWASGEEYEGREDLGNIHPGDGVRYKGRGFIQLTGRGNYRNYGTELGIDLESNPDLALDPETAARILAVYLQPRAEKIEVALKNGNYARARKYVNGGINGLEKMKSSYVAAMQALGLEAAPEDVSDDCQEKIDKTASDAKQALMTKYNCVSGKLNDSEIGRLGGEWGNNSVNPLGIQGFRNMATAFQTEFGRTITVNDSYRNYAEQVAIKKLKTDIGKPNEAATPGRSTHGWGFAIDLGGGIEAFDSDEYKWMQQHAISYGWNHPAWAEPNGSTPEPWHWEYVGGGSNESAPAPAQTPAPVPAPTPSPVAASDDVAPAVVSEPIFTAPPLPAESPDVDDNQSNEQSHSDQRPETKQPDAIELN